MHTRLETGYCQRLKVVRPLQAIQSAMVALARSNKYPARTVWMCSSRHVRAHARVNGANFNWNLGHCSNQPGMAVLSRASTKDADGKVCILLSLMLSVCPSHRHYKGKPFDLVTSLQHGWIAARLASGWSTSIDQALLSMAAHSHIRDHAEGCGGHR
jgi:hypothetical protein